jgi:peptidoglycan/xylan/chitin deacetylase (PgdA/CDA1 family)
MLRRISPLLLLFCWLAGTSLAQSRDLQDIASSAGELEEYQNAQPAYPQDSLASPEDVEILYGDPNAVLDTVGEYNDYFTVTEYTPVNGDEVIYSLGDELDPLDVQTAEVKSSKIEDHRCAILMYHRFEPFPRNAYEISPTEFDRQMAYIADNGFTVISLDQLVQAIYKQDIDSLPEKSVVITVDDGYRCFLTRAVPILQKYGFTATLFVYTNYVNTGGRSLTWDELRELESMGFDVECHSTSHPNFNNFKKYGSTKESYTAFAYHELKDPKELLEKQLGKPVKYFCWPYGEVNDYAMGIAMKCGYEATLSIKQGAVGLKSNPLYLNRFGIYSQTTMQTFITRLNGKIIYQPEELKGTVFYYTDYGSSNYGSSSEGENLPEVDIDSLYNAIFEPETTTPANQDNGGQTTPGENTAP